MAVLSLPAVLLSIAGLPIAVFLLPSVLRYSALSPIAVLRSPVVLKYNAELAVCCVEVTFSVAIERECSSGSVSLAAIVENEGSHAVGRVVGSGGVERADGSEEETPRKRSEFVRQRPWKRKAATDYVTRRRFSLYVGEPLGSIRGFTRMQLVGRICETPISFERRQAQAPYKLCELEILKRSLLFVHHHSWGRLSNSIWALTFSICAVWSFTVAARRATMFSNSAILFCCFWKSLSVAWGCAPLGVRILTFCPLALTRVVPK